MSSLSRHIGVLGQIAAFYLLHFLFFGRHFVDGIRHPGRRFADLDQPQQPRHLHLQYLS